jgi:hypothetical protein
MIPFLHILICSWKHHRHHFEMQIYVSKIFQQDFFSFFRYALRCKNPFLFFPLFNWIFAFIIFPKLEQQMWVYWSKSWRIYPRWSKPSKCKPTRYLIPFPHHYYVANYCNMWKILIKKTSLSFNSVPSFCLLLTTILFGLLFVNFTISIPLGVQF